MKKSGVFKILIVVVLIVFMGVGVYAFLNSAPVKGSGNDLSVSTFYCTINRKVVNDHIDGILVSFDSPLDVAVSFPYANIDPASAGYTVKIVPSGKVNFEFVVGATVHTLVLESDLTSMFYVDSQLHSFRVSSDKTFQELFSSMYPGEDVYVDLSTLTASNSDMFRIIVTSADGSVITIDFSYVILPESVSVDSEVILF